MANKSDAVAAAARRLIGTRFRPQGREPAHGLDCVGVAVVALAEAGWRGRVPRDYPQRGGSGGTFAAIIDRSGLASADPAGTEPGDILLIEMGVAQFHLAVRTSGGFVHADAGLRRVVETPGLPRQPVVGAWRIAEEQG